MNFKEWILSEISKDLSELPMQNIELLPYDYGYFAKFNYNGQEFSVNIIKTRTYLAGVDLENIYNISFKVQKGYSATNMNSPKDALKIYSHLIAAVAKVVEKEELEGNPINGFKFTAFSDGMVPIYNKFYQNYLKPRGFTQIRNIYVSKNYLHQKMEELKIKNHINAQSAWEEIISRKREDKDLLKQIKNTRKLARIQSPPSWVSV